MSEWQPIETAPHSDEDLLVYCADTDESFVAFRMTEQLFQYAREKSSGITFACKPTHWMPLPESPEVKS